MADLLDLVEYVRSDNQLQVDEEKAVLRNARMLGLKSANGRTYTLEAVKKAVGLYEGRPCNVNHGARPGDSRSAYDRFGWWENVRQDHDGGLRGDLHYLKAHPLSASVVEAARRNPSIFGVSHTARGRQRVGSREEVIESIESVASVDLVAEPATVSGLHESRTTVMGKKVGELLESLKASHPGYARGLGEAVASGILSPSAQMGDTGDSAGETADYERAILDAAKVCLEDTSLANSDKLAKIRKLLALLDDPKGKDPNGKGTKTESKTVDAEKDADRDAELQRLKARDLLRTIADDAGVKLSRPLLEAVRPNITEAEARALVEEFKTASVGGQKPRSAAPKPGQPTKKDANGQVTESKVPEAGVGKWLSGGR